MFFPNEKSIDISMMTNYCKVFQNERGKHYNTPSTHRQIPKFSNNSFTSTSFKRSKNEKKKKKRKRM